MPKAKPSSTAIADIVAVVGSDESEVKGVAASRAAAMAPRDAGDLGTDIIDGTADYVDQAVEKLNATLDALLTLPFFGGEKLVWLKSANFFADSVMGRSESVLEAGERLLKVLQGGLPSGTRFLLSALDIDKRRTFYKTLSKVAEVEVYDRLDTSKAGWEEEAMRMVESSAHERGLTFQEEALEMFVQFSGGDRRQVENELEKLDLYIQPRRPITVADVRLMVPVSKGGVVFELGNAIAQRDPALCFKLIDQLLEQGEQPVGLMQVAVIPTIRNLLLVKDLMERHKIRPPQKPWFFGSTLEKLPESATAHLPRKKDGGLNAYPLGIAAANAAKFNAEELRVLLEVTLEANVQLVTTQLDPKAVFGKIVARLAA